MVVGAGSGPGGGAGDVARVEEAEATSHVAAVGDKGDVHFGRMVEVLLAFVWWCKRWVLLLALCGHALGRRFIWGPRSNVLSLSKQRRSCCFSARVACQSLAAPRNEGVVRSWIGGRRRAVVRCGGGD